MIRTVFIRTPIEVSINGSVIDRSPSENHHRCRVCRRCSNGMALCKLMYLEALVHTAIQKFATRKAAAARQGKRKHRRGGTTFDHGESGVAASNRHRRCEVGCALSAAWGGQWRCAFAPGVSGTVNTTVSPVRILWLGSATSSSILCGPGFNPTRMMGSSLV